MQSRRISGLTSVTGEPSLALDTHVCRLLSILRRTSSPEDHFDSEFWPGPDIERGTLIPPMTTVDSRTGHRWYLHTSAGPPPSAAAMTNVEAVMAFKKMTKELGI